MSATDEKSIDEQIAEQETRIEQIDAEHQAAKKAQYLIDVTALAGLKAEHGPDRLVTVEIRGWEAGSKAATLAVAKVPEKSAQLYKRFVDMCRRSKKGEKLDDEEVQRAGDMLAESSILYPRIAKKGETPDGVYEATLELAPGLLTSVANALLDRAMGREKERGKG